MNEKSEVEGKARSAFYTALEERLAESAKARDLTNTLLLKLVNEKDHQSLPPKSQRSPVAPLLSRLALLSGGLIMGSLYALLIFSFYEFIHLLAWLLSIAPESGAVLTPEVQPLPTLADSIPTEVGATDKLEQKPASVTPYGPSFWYWTAIVSIGSIVGLTIYRVMFKGAKTPGTSDKEGEASDRSRSLDIIQNLPNVPHTTLHQVQQTMESHKADSSCQTDSTPSSSNPSGVSTQTGPPLDLISSDMDLNTRFEKLQDDFLEEQSKHRYEQAKSFSEMAKYKIEAEEAFSFMKEFHLTQYFEGWKTNMIEGFIGLRDRILPSRPQSPGVRDPSKDSGPPEFTGGREQSKPPALGPTSSEGESSNVD